MLGYTCVTYWVIPSQCTGSYLFNVMGHTCAHAVLYLCSVLGHNCAACWVIPVQCAELYQHNVLGHTCAVCWSYLNSVLGHTCALCWVIPVQYARSYLHNVECEAETQSFYNKAIPTVSPCDLVTSKITPSDNKTGQLNFNTGFQRNRQAIADLLFRKYSSSL